MEETKVALVPSVVVSGFPARRYAILLTNARALFVFTRGVRLVTSVAAVAGAIVFGYMAVLLNVHDSAITDVAVFGGAGLCALVTWRLFPASKVDFDRARIEDLSDRKTTLDFPYSSIEAVQVRKARVGPAMLSLAYADVEGKREIFGGLLYPEPKWTRTRLDLGRKRSEIYAEYANAVLEALKQAIPRDIVSYLGAGK